jgi:alpha-N-arabinofuranosidase
VFLATRPYRDNLYNIGRETYLLPVEWQGGWPVILDHGKPIPTSHARPLPSDPAAPPQTGSFAWRDEFDGQALGPAWMTMRAAPVTVADGELRLDARRDGIGDLGKPAFAARRQQHGHAVVSTLLRFDPREGESAGLAALQNDDFFLSIALTRRDGQLLVRVARRAGHDAPRDGETLAQRPVAGTGPIELRLRAADGVFGADMRRPGADWTRMADDVDASHLSTDKAGGFVGTMIGPFAQGPR